jgi:hypothetical protein
VTSSTVGLALHPQLLQRGPQLLARELVQRAEGLVQQQQLRVVHQRAAQRRALQHAARQLPGPLVAEALQAHLGQQRLGAVGVFAVLLLREVGAEGLHDLQRHHHVLADGQPGQHGRVLEGQADAQPVRGSAGAPASRPRTTTPPLLGCSRLATSFRMVLLPQPLGPTSATKSPWSICRSVRSSASVPLPPRAP